MTTGNGYWTFARECTRWAQETENPEHRRAFFDMAKVWTQLALNDATPTKVDNPERRLAVLLGGLANYLPRAEADDGRHPPQARLLHGRGDTRPWER
jgi:ferric-dicitrate binding protein FerR (iron transport regulator)